MMAISKSIAALAILMAITHVEILNSYSCLGNASALVGHHKDDDSLQEDGPSTFKPVENQE